MAGFKVLVGIRPGLPGLTDPGVPLGTCEDVQPCAELPDSDCKTLLKECVCGLCAGERI